MSVEVSIAPELMESRIKALIEENEKLKVANSHLQLITEYQTHQTAAERSVTSTKQNFKSSKKSISDDDFVISEYMEDGRHKPRAMDSIRSYDEFKKIQDYFLSRKQYRDYAMWTVGVSFGLRVSDLVRLKWEHLLDADNNWYTRVNIREKKTKKINGLLITESVQNALSILASSIGSKNFDRSDFIFKSQKGGAIQRQRAWLILSNAAKHCGLEDLAIGSHTMRKTAATIEVCTDNRRISNYILENARIMLNHSNVSSTLHYLKVYDKWSDDSRKRISDFVLGKSEINELKLTGEEENCANQIAELNDTVDELKEIIMKIGGCA